MAKKPQPMPVPEGQGKPEQTRADLALRILDEATKRFPQLKYAWGVVGIVAVVGLTWVFRMPATFTIIGSLCVIVGMGVLVAFEHAASLPKKAKRWHAHALLLLCVLEFGFVLSAINFGWPKPLARLLHVSGDEPVAAGEQKLPITKPQIQMKQEKFLESWDFTLKEPDEVFNEKSRDFIGSEIIPLVCKFESIDRKPESPTQGRRFIANLSDSCKVVAFLKPGDEGIELEHLEPGDDLELIGGWYREFIKFIDRDYQTLDAKPVTLIRIADCVYKKPL